MKADAPKECTLNKYRITDRMYNRVLDKEPEVIVKVKSCEFEKKKSSKTSANIDLDAAVLTWFKQARDRGDPISGPIIQEKARILNEKLGGLPTFEVRKLTTKIVTCIRKILFSLQLNIYFTFVLNKLNLYYS